MNSDPTTTTAAPAEALATPADEPMRAMADALEAILALDGLEQFRATHSLPAAFFSLLDAALAAYDRLERPCPFLDQTAGTCRIYPVRPLVCRWFNNRSPADWCRPDHPKYLERDAVGVYPDARVNDLLAALDARLGLTTVNYLAGAFVHIAGDVLGGAPLK